MADPTARNSVKMKFMGRFNGTTKIVQLPIPLISKSQKLEQELFFTREDKSHGPAFCDVPMDWAGALMAVGGNFQINEKLTPELQGKIDAAKSMTDSKMKAFAEENEAVEV